MVGVGRYVETILEIQVECVKLPICNGRMGKRGELPWRFCSALRTRGSDIDKEAILLMRAVLIAQIKRSSGKRVMLVLSKEVLGSRRLERALVGPIVVPGV